MLGLSTAAAAAAGATSALRPARFLLGVLRTLVVGGLWAIVSWMVFIAGDLGHGAIGPISF